MIHSAESYLPLLKGFLFYYILESDQKSLMSSATVFTVDRGQRIPRDDNPSVIYFLIEGEATLRLQNGLDISRVSPGRSFELRPLLLKEKSWHYIWTVERKSTILSIPWAAFEQALVKNTEAYQYLLRISQSVVIQRLKRDLSGLGLSRGAIVETIARLHQETVDHIFSDWNRKVFLLLFQGQLNAHVKFNDKRHIIDRVKAGDSFLLDLQSTNLTFEAEDDSRAWVLFESEWLTFQFKNEFKQYLDTFNLEHTRRIASEDDDVTRLADLNDQNISKENIKAKFNYNSNFGSSFLFFWRSFFRPVVFGSRDENKLAPAALASIAKHFGYKMGMGRIEAKIGGLATTQSIEGLSSSANLLGFKSTVHLSKTVPLNKQYWPCVVNLNNGIRILYAANHEQSLLGDPETGETFVTSTREVNLRLSEEKFVNFEVTENLKDRPENGIPYFDYLRLLFKSPRLVTLYLIAGTVSFVLALALPVLNQYLFDVVIGERNTRLLVPVMILIISFSVFSGMLSLFNQKVSIDLATIISIRLKKMFQNRLFDLPSNYLRSFGSSGILTRFLDVEQIAQFFAQGLLGSFLGIFLMFGSLSVLWLYHHWLAFLVVALVPLEVILVRFLKPALQDAKLELTQLKARESRMIVEHFAASEDLKPLKGQLTSRWRWELSALQGAKNLRRSGILSSIFQVSHFLVGEIVKIICFIVAVRLYLKGELTLGQVIGTSFLVPKVSQPIQGMISTYFQYLSVRPLMLRLNDLIFAPIEILSGQKLKRDKIKGDIEFKNVSFSFDGSSRLALNNISFKIKSGEKIAIVGPSGSGKSSLSNLLNGVFEPSSGKILLDGHDVSELSLGALRNDVCVVEQEGGLFSGTIQENIAWGDSEPDVERVQRAAAMAELEEEILARPGGFASPLSHGGTGVSEGQRQRLLLARVLYRNPSVIVLDEATSHLDPISEERVMNRLLNEFEDKTVILFTHRVHLAINADRIFYMEDGKLLESGNHETLIKEKQKYYDFFLMHLSVG